MIEQSNFKKLRVYSQIIMGKSAQFLTQLPNGDFLKTAAPGTVQTLAAASSLGKNDNGKTFVLSLAGGFETDLPAPVQGMKLKFIVGIAPTTAYTIVTSGSANIIHGQISTPEDAAGSVATAAAADTITFVANLAIIGDYVELESDGTNWYISGMCKVQDGMTTTQAT